MAQQSERAIFEPFDASGYRVGIVVAQFNRDICEKLLESARETLGRYRVSESAVTVHRVAGSVEIPVILKALAGTGTYDCLVALGAVIRGETAHFDYVAKIASEGVLRVMMDYGTPVGFGILTCDTQKQAIARTEAGGAAAEAALQSAKIVRANGKHG